MSNSNSQETLCTPLELRVLAENVAQDLLPLKSKKYFKAADEKFIGIKKKTTRQLHRKIAFSFTLTKWLKNVNLNLVHYFLTWNKYLLSGTFKFVLFPFVNRPPPEVRPWTQTVPAP